ncbi:MAG: SagB/ThcOx family dehydrogenase [Lentisphaerae bacterium]|jgi:nitroreductase|nr:SagB/ThcOx family dehydrogenase [Lentisphaerota bacterium]
MKMKTLILQGLLSVSCLSHGQDAVRISLPKAVRDGGKPLMEALAQRKTIRTLKGDDIGAQNLSNLLWAAYGFNREGMRTAPSAMNKQGLELYVVRGDGAWLYEAQTESLLRVAEGDLRSKTADAKRQAFALKANLTLVFVFDTTKIPKLEGVEIDAVEWAKLDTGFAAQNAYLYCASAGLGCCARGSFNGKELEPALNLGPGKIATLCLPVGLPE